VPPSALNVHRLGTVPYEEALALQERLVEARIRGDVEDTLLLLEHPPVITLGRGAKREHLLVDEDFLRSQGVDLHEIGRGGDVTYHGPGQLVGYPIVSLTESRRDVRRYVCSLEDIMIRLAGRWGLSAGRVEGLQGAWIDDRKIGAVGVRIRRWVTMHGFAFNVTTDLAAFGVIVPCGISDRGVTSLAQEVGAPVAMEDVIAATTEIAGEVFGAEIRVHDGPPDV